MKETSPQSKYLHIFEQAGLTENQALVYEALLTHGEMNAAAIFNKTPLKKGLLYKVLEDLEGLELIEKNETLGKVTTFSPAHPDALKKLITIKEEQIKNASHALEGIWQSLAQDFNSIANKPVITYFEGDEGIAKVTNDSLSSKSEVLTYLDFEVVDKNAPELNTHYLQKRLNLKISKRILAKDSKYSRERIAKDPKPYRQVKFITSPFPFDTAMQIYDNKISYITFSKERKIGVIIEDATIALLHKSIFEDLWKRVN